MASTNTNAVSPWGKNMSQKSSQNAYILGVGMTRFVKPRNQNDYTEMAFEAGIKAMWDANITYDDVERGVASYCYGDSTCGQRVFYQFGMTGIPIYNVNNNCASGSTAMVMACDFVKHGMADCVLAVGFEKMATGSLAAKFADRTNPLDRAMEMSEKIGQQHSSAPFAAQMFGNAAEEYIQAHGATAEDFAEIARINHEHSQNNPYAQFRDAYSHEQVLASPKIHGVLTKLQCCPTSDGAAAAVVVSERFLQKHPSSMASAVEVAGQSLCTDSPALYDGSALNLVGRSMARNCATQALEQAETSIQNVKVVELHDCFSSSEMNIIDAIGLSKPGRAHEYVREGSITYGSNHAVVNPSGGLISKGHPLGATGIAQCAELVWQLRGWATNRLVPVPKGSVALQQNAGLGGACVVTILRRADHTSNDKRTDQEILDAARLDYNPATEARGLTSQQIEKVRSVEYRNDWAMAKGSYDSRTPTLSKLS